METDSKRQWIVKGKRLTISFLGEAFPLNWEIVAELDSGRVIGNLISNNADASSIAGAITNALMTAASHPSEIILMHNSSVLLSEVQGLLALKGMKIPVFPPNQQQEIRGYLIDMFLEQLERRLPSLDITGKTKLEVARGILMPIVSLYSSMVNDPPKKLIMEKKAEDKKIEENKPATAYTPPPIKEHVLQEKIKQPFSTSSIRPRILIADDSFAELQLVDSVLKEAGYDTVTVMDGEAAEYKMRVEKFDAAVIDIIMPKKNGYQVCRDLRKDPAYRDVPIIMVSSKSQTSDKMWGLKQGANEYITKPFSPKDLVSVVKKYVKSHA